MPKKLLADFYGADLEDLDVQEDEQSTGQDIAPEAQDQVAPAGVEA